MGSLNQPRLNHAYHTFGVAVVAFGVVFFVEAIAKEHGNALIEICLKRTNKSFGNGIAWLITLAVNQFNQ